MDDTVIAGKLKELLLLFLPEVRKMPWWPNLTASADPDAICAAYAVQLPWMLAGGEQGEPPDGGLAPSRELFESDAGLTMLLIATWLTLLAGDLADCPGEDPTAIADSGHMWPRSFVPMAEQFFSNPVYPAWDDVRTIFNGVRARLPAGEALPPAALDLLRT